MQAQRDLGQAVTDTKYACLYAELNERFWRHMDTGLNLLGALGGSSAIAGVLSQNAALNLAAGIALAVASSVQLVLRPSDKAVDFRDARRAFLGLESRAWGMGVVEPDAERKTLASAHPVGFRLLELPAYNAVVRQLGHDDMVEPLKWRHELALLLA